MEETRGPVRARVTFDSTQQNVDIAIVDIRLSIPEVVRVPMASEEVEGKEGACNVAERVVATLRKKCPLVTEIDVGPDVPDDVVLAVLNYMARPLETVASQRCSITIQRHMLAAAAAARGFERVVIGPVTEYSSVIITCIDHAGRQHVDERDITVPYIEPIEALLSGIAAQGVKEVVISDHVPVWVGDIARRVFNADVRHK